MTTISTVNEQLNDTAITSKLIQHCLRTPAILRKVLEQFSNSDLLKLSLVNKQWNFEARSVLRDRADLIATISPNDPAKSFAAFASDLGQMQVVPFSGIHALLFDAEGCRSSSVGALNPLHTVILDRLPCKRFSVSFRDNWNERHNEELELVLKILEGFGGILEDLSITVDWGDGIFLQVLPDRNFPSLKTLRIEGCSADESLTYFVKALVSRAPNLQELNLTGLIYFHGNVLEGSSAVLVPNHEFYFLHKPVADGLMSSLRAKVIEVRASLMCYLDVERLNRAIPMALQASHTSLNLLRMDLLLAVPLMCYGICLENVTKLEIFMIPDTLECTEPNILRHVKDFNFTQVFPKLEQVVVNLTPVAITADQISGFVEQRNGALQPTLPDRAVNIKHLTLTESIWSSSIPFWAQMFPHVETLSINAGYEDLSLFPFRLLWEEFANVEELTLTSNDWGRRMTVNLDSVFCGIFPEEVAELSEKDDEYLRAVNIVPAMPAITCMTGLRTFTLDLKMVFAAMRPPGMEPGSAFLFSKVTALIGFARWPVLTVTFKCNSHAAEALSHMRPSVPFVIGSSDA